MAPVHLRKCATARKPLRLWDVFLELIAVFPLGSQDRTITLGLKSVNRNLIDHRKIMFMPKLITHSCLSKSNLVVFFGLIIATPVRSDAGRVETFHLHKMGYPFARPAYWT